MGDYGPARNVGQASPIASPFAIRPGRGTVDQLVRWDRRKNSPITFGEKNMKILVTILGIALTGMASVALAQPAAQDAGTPAVEAPPAVAAPAKAPKPKLPTPAKLFKAADGDKDGKVSLADIHASYPKFPAKRFAQLDKNSDGVLERSELPVAKAPKPKAKTDAPEQAALTRYAKRLVKDLDGDGNQQVSLEEIQAAKPGFPASSFAVLDKNKNGLLDALDFAPKAMAPGAETETKKVSEDAAERLMKKEQPDRERIRKADVNGDRKLSFEEAQVAFPEITRERFDHRDRNKDGFLGQEDRATR